VKDKSFYRAFEDRFRGSRELVKSRLSVYLPFVVPLKAIYEECKVIDLGCGRGEWLELMADEEFEAHGVDIDDTLLAVCSGEGLSVTRADAVEYLQKLQDESVVVVSGFHIIEHIPFESVQILVSEAFRVLKPGGLLILETPNPENLMVTTTEFYLDPTHRKPVPSKLLCFLAEYNNFYRIKLLRLQESPSLYGLDDLRVTDVFFGVSPDYAVVAQKSAPEEQLRLFDQAFGKEYGLTIDELALRYTQKDQKLIAYERERWAWWEGEWNIEKARIEELNGQINHWRSSADNLNRELQTVYASRSWRITGPLRSAFCMLLRIRKKLSRILQYVQQSVILPLVQRVPPLKAWIYRSASSTGSDSAMQLSSGATLDISGLPLHSRCVYADLKAAIEQKRSRN
jgi:SAM-dependent methyltransferase